MRCVACGATQWNLRTQVDVAGNPVQRCRVCDEVLRPERRRPGRRFTSGAERRTSRPGTSG